MTDGDFRRHICDSGCVAALASQALPDRMQNFTGVARRPARRARNAPPLGTQFLSSLAASQQQREANRERTKAASVLQKFVRGSLERQRLARELCSSWDGRSVFVWSRFFPLMAASGDGDNDDVLTAQLKVIRDTLVAEDAQLVLRSLGRSLLKPEKLSTRLLLEILDTSIVCFESSRSSISTDPFINAIVTILQRREAQPSVLPFFTILSPNASCQCCLSFISVMNNYPNDPAVAHLNILDPILPQLANIPSSATYNEYFQILTFIEAYFNLKFSSSRTSISLFCDILLNFAYKYALNFNFKLISSSFYQGVVQAISEESILAKFTYTIFKLISTSQEDGIYSSIENEIMIKLTQHGPMHSQPNDPYEVMYMNKLYIASFTFSTDDDKILAKMNISNEIFIKHMSVVKQLFNDVMSDSISDSPLISDFLQSCISLAKTINSRNYSMKILDPNFWHITNIPMNCLNQVGQHINQDPNVNLNFKTKILLCVPFLIPFELRAQIFHQCIEDNKLSTNQYRHQLQGLVSRENTLHDSFLAFAPLGPQFKEPISVKFQDGFGQNEAGIDGGGLTKELLGLIIDEIKQKFIRKDHDQSINKQHEGDDELNGLMFNWKFWSLGQNFKLYPNNELFFKFYDYKQRQIEESNEFKLYLSMVKFLGMVIGKCIYDNVLIDVEFVNFFLKRWTGDNSLSFNDLKEIDLGMFRQISNLLKNSSDDDLESMNLTMSVVDKYYDRQATEKYVEIDLIPNGRDILVNKSNLMHYIMSLTKFKLQSQMKGFIDEFLKGLFCIIKPELLSLFDSFELQRLISGGDESEVDIDDLFNNMDLNGGGFILEDQTIQDLYHVLKDFDTDQMKHFLKFVTSCSKQPLLGFKELQPRFSIRNVGRADLTRLPTASTCVNLLKIPDYRDRETLRRKLIQAIESKAGFDLS